MFRPMLISSRAESSVWRSGSKHGVDGRLSGEISLGRSGPDDTGERRPTPSLALARRADFPLGAATVRPSIRSIEGAGGTVVLEPLVMQVLLAFVDAEGAVLTREELMSTCWPGAAVVGDDSVNRTIAEVRRAARNAEAGFGIETIARVGYRLTVEGGGEAIPALNGASVDIREETPTGTTRRMLLAGGTAALSLGGITFWATRPQPPDPRTASLIEESRVAIRAGTSTADRQAIALLERAIAISPDSAAAWGLLSLTKARIDEHAAPDSKVSPAVEVDKAAHRALALDGGNADAKAALAIAIPYYGDWLSAERRFEAVLREHPGHLVTRDSRAFLLAAVGRVREGAQARLAPTGEADFDANHQYGLIYAYWFLDRIEEADRVASRAMQMWPQHSAIWLGRLWVLADTGRCDRALAQIDDVAARPPLPPPMFGTLRAGISAAHSRRRSEIDQAVARVMASARRSVAAVVNGMMLLNLMGATDRAFDLARAYYLEQGSLIVATQARPGQPIVPDQRRRKTNMLFTPTAAAMQRDPRFPTLMEAMGLADYWRRRGIVPDYRQGTA